MKQHELGRIQRLVDNSRDVPLVDIRRLLNYIYTLEQKIGDGR